MKKDLLFVGIALSIMSNIALAEDSEITNKFKLSANVGNASHKLHHNGVENYNKSATSYGINLDYSFSDYLALGMGYVNLGKAKYFHNQDPFEYSFSNKGKGVTVSGLISTGEKFGAWSAFARIGLINWQLADIGVSEFNERYESKNRRYGTDVFSGVGASYRLSKDLQISLTADWYKMKYDENIFIIDSSGNLNEETFFYKQGLTVIGLGLTYSF